MYRLVQRADFSFKENLSVTFCVVKILMRTLSKTLLLIP